MLAHTIVQAQLQVVEKQDTVPVPVKNIGWPVRGTHATFRQLCNSRTILSCAVILLPFMPPASAVLAIDGTLLKSHCGRSLPWEFALAL